MTNPDPEFKNQRTILNSDLSAIVVGGLTSDTHALASALKTEGYTTHRVGDGAAAIKLAGAKAFDIVVLTLTVADPDCIEALRVLRRYNSHSGILVLTEPGSTDLRIAALETGADEYLIQPVFIAPFTERIATLVRRKQLEAQRIVQVSDLTIDSGNRTAVRGGRRIELTDREFDLLWYLGRRSGEVISRAELLDRVYESDSSSASNVVDVYIRYLRQKIELAGTSKLLHTYRGRGYMLGELGKMNPPKSESS